MDASSDRIRRAAPSLGLTLVEAAQHMGVSKRTVERWIQGERLAVYREGRVVRVSVEAIERFRELGTVDVITPAASVPRRRQPRQGSRLQLGERLSD